MNDIPTLYAYFHMKVKDSSNIDLININTLTEIIKRIVYRRGGIPKFMIKEIIEDLIKLKLIERVSFNTYKINDDKCYKKIKRRVACYF
jgi:predicted transcriptional regulator